MEPPSRASGISPDSSPRTKDTSQLTSTSTSTSTSTGLISPAPANEGKYSAQPSTSLPTTQSVQDAATDDILGQFSFAPATQTTVVTTTTTTTTKFPPLLMKAPHHLHELDSKLYPLASSPTPKSIKRFCFDIGGKPTLFSEADDTTDTLQELKHQQDALKKSDGVLRSFANFETPKPNLSHSKPIYSPLNQKLSFSPASQKRPASPVSISEATYLASSQGSRKRRHATFERTRSGLAEAISPALESSRSPSQATQGLDSYALDIGLDGSFDGQITGARRLRTASDHEINSPRLATPSTSQGMDVAAQVLSPASEVVRTNPFQDDGVDHESDQPGEAENPFLWPDSTSVAQATAHAGQSPSQHVQHRARPRPNALDTAAAQDISLPSPSLSPVTAAANLQSRRGYYEDENHANRTSADYNLSQAHNQNQVEKYSFQDGMLESQGSIKSTITPYPTGGLHISNHLSSTPSMMDIPTMLTSFEAMPAEMKTYVMYQLLRRCPKPVLHFVADTVGPALKCDFISLLPLELSLNIICHLDVKTLCRAAQVSKKWRQIVDSDEKAWKNLLDADGYILPDGELQRAIREGWGWQHASRPDDWEKDLGAAGPVASDTEWSVTSAHGVLGGLAALTSSSSDLATPPTKRPKRKAATKSKTKPRKQQKKQDANMELATNVDMEAWKDKSSSCEGPYAAANAAAAAVPFPEVGLPRLKNLHLFKSIYQRHHIIRKSWMQDETKPRHIAFRAHQRHVVTCLQFDTDKILTGSDDKNINVYDTQTGALRARLEGHEGGVWALQYEGNVLVSGSTDRSVRVWDIEKGVCTHVFQGHTSTVRCLQILMPTAIQEPDGTITMMPKQPLIITGSRDSNLRVWELPKPNDKPFFQAGPPPDEKECPYFVRVLTGHQQSVRAIAAHADTLVSGSYDYTVRVWKISTGETVHRLQGHTQKVYSVVLDHKRNRCISGSMDNHVKIWSLETGMALFNLEGHSSLVGLLDLQQDRLVSAAADSTLRIWDPENGNCKSTLTAHTGAITCFQHDGQKVISGSDRTLKMWNISTGEFVKDLLTELSGVWQVKFNERRCVAAVQRNNLTYIEVLDFGASRDGVPDYKRGRRIVVNTEGQEISDPYDLAVDMELISDE